LRSKLEKYQADVYNCKTDWRLNFEKYYSNQSEISLFLKQYSQNIKQKNFNFFYDKNTLFGVKIKLH